MKSKGLNLFLLAGVAFFPISATGAQKPAVTVTATSARASEAGLRSMAFSSGRQAPTGTQITSPALPTGMFTVARQGSTLFPLTVEYTVGGTAAGGSDYIALSGRVEIPRGSSSATITVTPLDDSIYEGSETVVVSLKSTIASPYVSASPDSATITIVDDEIQVSIKATDDKAYESGLDSASFTVTRAGPTAEDLNVSYVILGSAINGSDYDSVADSVTIRAGSSTVAITIKPKDDKQAESVEQVTLKLKAGSDYSVGSAGVADVSIWDNDTTVTIGSNVATVHELLTSGSTIFTVTRSGNTALTLSVSYSIGGTATNGVDYSTIPSVVVIPSGQTSATIELQPIADSISEGDETVILTLSGASKHYTLGAPATATITIKNQNNVTIRPGD